MDLIFIAILLAALGSGLIAGAFFAFSSFVMRALGRLPAREGIAAMQSINIVVINPVFMTVFLGTAALSLLLAVLSVLDWSSPALPWRLAGSVLYFAGTFVVTIVFNVPLNNALAAAEDTAVWNNYLKTWTRWNTLRTIAATLAAALFAITLSRY